MNKKLLMRLLVFACLALTPLFCRAMAPGTLLYRTTDDGKAYGYSGDPLIEVEGGIIKSINPGHVGIYIGRENGEDYVVEASANGLVKTPAKYFVNLAANEKFLGAKIPLAADALERAKVVLLAKSLAGKSLAYDFDFKYQKGPESGQWTCVGLTEKIYESAAISNPNNLAALEYDPAYYAVDITPDGFDNYSVISENGDCFSRDYEFSKIARHRDFLLPAPELIGFDAGREYKGERYIFLPYTQFLQPTLGDVPVDIVIASSFDAEEIRGRVNVPALILRWSLLNNPVSSVKQLAGRLGDLAVKTADKTKEVAKIIGEKIFGAKNDTEIVLDDQELKKSTGVGKTTVKAAVAKTTVNKTPLITVNKATSKLTTPVSSTSKTASAILNGSTVASVPVSSSASTASLVPVPTSAASTAAALVAYYSPPAVQRAVDQPASETENSAVVQNVNSTVNAEANSSAASASASTPTSSSSSSSSSSTATTTDFPTLAIINKIYATGDNDWVELFNPTDHDFDLAVAGYRLEKAKTAEDPGLMIRLGNPADGAYPGGTVISAHGTYLIVRDDANDYYRARADAIATRDEFAWTASGYTLYLGTDAISSSADLDLTDAVGFGSDATYFQGSGPAPAVGDNYILNRLANNGNNQTDFNLIVSDDPSVVIPVIEENSATSTEETIPPLEDTATSTEEIIPPTEDTATSTEEIIPPAEDTATSTEEIVEEEIVAEENGEENVLKLALINKIYATGDNDWVELFNPTDHDFDLATAGYRLEKAKTAEDPSLMMRIGNTEDGSYPQGTVIAAGESYLIVRDDANEYYKSRADAIATRDEFVWTGSGYTLYLGTDAISSSTDPDIIEAVGFGPDATYFQGSGPAPAINDNYILQRTAKSGDNIWDFALIPSDDPAIAVVTETATTTVATAGLFVPPVPLESSGLTDLWHFDECYGEGSWTVGKWDCAREVGHTNDELTASLTPAVDLSSFSVAFYYKKQASDSPRLDWRLANDDGDYLRFVLEPGLITVEGLPESEWRYYLDVPWGEVWHQAVLVVDQAADYWAVYLDGQEVIKETFLARLPLLTDMTVGGDGGSVLIDELAIWNRPLAAAEISVNYTAAVPFSPLTTRSSQLPAELKYLWDFEEADGDLAGDSVGSSTLQVLPTAWTARSHDNYALKTLYNKTFTADFPESLISQDLSLTFWWRNVAYPKEGRANIYLTGNRAGNEDEEINLFALLANYYRQGFWFNGVDGILSQGIDKTIPNDDLWHHLALVYDSYRYRLTLYVDGEETVSWSLIWMLPTTEITGLKISSDGQSAALDSLGIWQGALSPSQIREIYSNIQ